MGLCSVLLASMSSKSLTVKSAEEALAAIKGNPDNFLVIEKKKDDKAYKGTRFLNAKTKIGGVLSDGWISATDVQFGRGIADPQDLTDKRNEFEGTRLAAATTVSNAGALGEYALALNGVWLKQVDALISAGVINLGNRKVHGIVQTHTGDSAKEPDVVIDDPIIRFKLDFGKYPDTHPIRSLRKTIKTTILDYSKPIEGKLGPYQYHPATVIDEDGVEQPVTKDNIHQFWTDGCVAKFLRFSMPSVAVSQGWVSWPMTIHTVVLEQGSAGGFSDDIIEEVVTTVQPQAQPTVQPQPSVQPQPQPQPQPSVQPTVQPPAQVQPQPQEGHPESLEDILGDL